jgi:hypothetical protein
MQAIEFDVLITETREIHLPPLPEHISASQAKVIVMYENEVIPRRIRYDSALYQVHSQLAELTKQVNELVEKKSCCALSASGEQSERVTEFLTGIKGKLKQDRKILSKWLNGIHELTIVDPYFLSWSENNIFPTEDEYTNHILKIIPASVEKLSIFHLPSPKTTIKYKFRKLINSRHIKTRYVETTELHDRVFINNDNNSAIVVGTSLGGYGNKLSFVLELPDEDLQEFLTELERIKSEANK